MSDQVARTAELTCLHYDAHRAWPALADHARRHAPLASLLAVLAMAAAVVAFALRQATAAG